MPRTIVFHNNEIIENRDITNLLKSTGIEEYYIKSWNLSLVNFIEETGYGYKSFLKSMENLKKSGISLNNLSFKVEEDQNDLLFFALSKNRYRQVKWLLKNDFTLNDSHIENLNYYKNEKRLFSLTKYINKLLLKNINVVQSEKWVLFLINQKDIKNIYDLYQSNKDFFSSENIDQILLLKDKEMNSILERDLLGNMLKSLRVQKNRL